MLPKQAFQSPQGFVARVWVLVSLICYGKTTEFSLLYRLTLSRFEDESVQEFSLPFLVPDLIVRHVFPGSCPR